MRLIGQALAGAVVLLASSLACAEGLEWVPRDTGGTPVVGGGSGGLPFHVCRAVLGNGVVVPGKTGGDRSGECRFVADGAEQAVTDFEVLAETTGTAAAYRWVAGHASSYPMHSVIGGSAADGTRLLVCAALDAADGSVHPGYIENENCMFGRNGAQLEATSYLVLASNDPQLATSAEALPAEEGFDPGHILAVEGVAAFCAAKDGTCVPKLPASF